MTRRNDSDRLPMAVRRAAAELRRMEPRSDFDARLRKALMEADRHEAKENDRGRNRMWARASRGLGLAALAAGAVLAGELWVQNDASEDVLHRIEELEIALDGDGHTWLPLTLDTEHHGGAHADVHVQAPHGVRVKASEHARADDEPTCGPSHCVHRFGHPTSEDTEPHLTIGVSAPGQYRIYVEHASPAQRVREVFVVAAR